MMNVIMYLSAALYLALGVIAVLQLRSCRGRAEPIAWIFLALHALVYFGALIYDFRNGVLENPLFWNAWSSSVRLHGVITIVMIEVFRLLRMRVIKRGC